MMAMNAAFTIKAVAKRTGLTTHTIRAWERRYGVLSPQRSESNRRLFSLEDVERLTLLKKATDQGHSIGSVAHLSNRELQSLCHPEAEEPDGTVLDLCVQAVSNLDAKGLHRLLVREANEVGVRRLVDDTIVPLLRIAGTRWRDSVWTVAHEHLASGVVRSFVEEMRARIQPEPSAKKAVFCTLSGQMHEIGALLACLEAALSGYDTTFLGANVPPADAAGTVRRINAEILAISLPLPVDAADVERQLVEVRKLIGPNVRLIVGGPAAEELRECLKRVGALVVGSLGGLRAALGS